MDKLAEMEEVGEPLKDIRTRNLEDYNITWDDKRKMAKDYFDFITQAGREKMGWTVPEYK